MVVLGIDPGLEHCGYGVIEAEGQRIQALAYGVVATSAQRPVGERLQRIHGELTQVIALYRPALAAVERLYFSRNVGSAIAVGEARGVALLSVAQQGVQLREYTPPEVKQAVCGYGAADKAQVLHMVRTILGLGSARMRDDTADALAIALCGFFRTDWEARAL